MLGVSLSFDWLTKGEGLPESTDAVLKALKNEGVKSIELRTVQGHHKSDDVLLVAERLWNEGFYITVHGTVKSAESAIADIFPPLEKLFENLRQPALKITIHPVDGDNVKMLNSLADFIEGNKLPAIVALENNRRMPNGTEGDSVKLVLDAVKEANRKEVGICWDMGHYAYWLIKNYPEKPAFLPPEEFLNRVIHTHIHALSGFTTHFPLDSHQLPLKLFIEGLSKYSGVYNIELEYPRYQGLREFLPSHIGSVCELKKQMSL